jgi:hypothetical protein
MAGKEIVADPRALAAAVYRDYARLMGADGAGLGGRLLLVGDSGSPADQHATETLVRAANIAGAGTLLLESDQRRGRDWVRSGACDFLVTTLDEALRILKNELRRKQPTAVCLPGDRVAAVEQCIARGVQPALLYLPGLDQDAQALVERGALMVAGSSLEDAEGDLFSADGRLWRMVSWSAPPRLLAEVDALALASMGGMALEARRRWLARSPQYLGREYMGRALAAAHTLAMQDDEAVRLTKAVSRAIADGRLPLETCVLGGGDPGLT